MSFILELNPYSQESSKGHLVAMPSVFWLGGVLFGFLVCLFIWVWGFFCTYFILQSVPFSFLPLEMRQSGFMEMIPFLLPRCALTLQPHRLQGVSMGKTGLSKGSCEVTASSSEGKAHRRVLFADQSLSFAEVCSTYAANCG